VGAGGRHHIGTSSDEPPGWAQRTVDRDIFSFGVWRLRAV
jgi:hypothetical protein